MDDAVQNSPSIWDKWKNKKTYPSVFLDCSCIVHVDCTISEDFSLTDALQFFIYLFFIYFFGGFFIMLIKYQTEIFHSFFWTLIDLYRYLYCILCYICIYIYIYISSVLFFFFSALNFLIPVFSHHFFFAKKLGF